MFVAHLTFDCLHSGTKSMNKADQNITLVKWLIWQVDLVSYFYRQRHSAIFFFLFGIFRPIIYYYRINCVYVCVRTLIVVAIKQPQMEYVTCVVFTMVALDTRARNVAQILV